MIICILGYGHSLLFLVAKGQVKFLLVVINYFTNWIETEPLSKIIVKRLKNSHGDG